MIVVHRLTVPARERAHIVNSKSRGRVGCPQPVHGIHHGWQRRRDAGHRLAVSPVGGDLPAGTDLNPIPMLVHEAMMPPTQRAHIP